MYQRHVPILLLSLTVLLVGIGCSISALLARPEPATPTPTKTLRPTFTPTPFDPAAATAVAQATAVARATAQALAMAQGEAFLRGEVRPTPPTATPPVTPLPTATPIPPTPTWTPTATDTPLPPTPTPKPTPYVEVIGDRVNVRSGPGTAYRRLGQVTQGQQFAVVAKNAAGDWWQVCCINGQKVWIIGRLVQVNGDVAPIPVAQNIPTPPPTPTPRPTKPPAPTPTPVPSYPFALAEVTGYATSNPWFLVHGKVWEPKSQTPLPGYRFKILRNGAEYGVSPEASIPGWRDATCDGCGDNRKVNIKYDNAPAPAGDATWTVFVIDAAGNQVSPPATIQTSAASPKWFYVQFDKK
ncbi:MAG TPA: SH3 domain-containing protein [Anaerolineae bacterium]|nr:SH3 domain-containing protein [Anaerolineae bacterium]